MNQKIARVAVTRNWNLEETIHRLSQSHAVAGIAEFGSRANARHNIASDYDLLIVFRDLPAEVFQIVTSIDGRIADVVPIKVELVERIIAEGSKAVTGRFEIMLAQKLRTARVLLDKDGLLERAQIAVRAIPEEQLLPPPATFEKRYGEMFWQGFVIQQVRRMSRANDDLHRLAADMMLSSILTQTYRSYFELRGLAWEGEKAALRFWLRSDIRCYELVQALINGIDLESRLTAFERLSTHVLAGHGEPIHEGETAVMFASDMSEAGVEEILDYWDSLFGNRA